MKPKRRYAQKQDIDLGLAVLSAIQNRHPNNTFSIPQIAEICGTSVGNIWRIQHKALKRARHRLKAYETNFDDPRNTTVFPDRRSFRSI